MWCYDCRIELTLVGNADTIRMGICNLYRCENCGGIIYWPIELEEELNKLNGGVIMPNEDYFKLLDEIEKDKNLSWAEKVEKSIKRCKRVLL